MKKAFPLVAIVSLGALAALGNFIYESRASDPALTREAIRGAFDQRDAILLDVAEALRSHDQRLVKIETKLKIKKADEVGNKPQK